MKLILREHVDHLGERGEIVNVAPGYARNFLIPKGLAWTATPGNIKQLEHQRRVWAARDTRELDEAQAFAARVGALKLSIARKAGESGTLYGSVTTSDVAELVGAKGFQIDRRKLSIQEPIKALGDYELQLRLHPKVSATIKVSVVAEEQSG